MIWTFQIQREHVGDTAFSHRFPRNIRRKWLENAPKNNALSQTESLRAESFLCRTTSMFGLMASIYGTHLNAHQTLHISDYNRTFFYYTHSFFSVKNHFTIRSWGWGKSWKTKSSFRFVATNQPGLAKYLKLQLWQRISRS
jgi:hypothetical protein